MTNHIDWKALGKKSDRLTNKHARETGRAISAWNLLHDTLGRLFAEIATPSNLKMAGAIWYSQVSDRSQRGMLKAASRIAYGEESDLYKAIKWMCERADSLAEKRNNVVHIGYSIDLDQTLSDVEIQPRGKGVSPRADAMSSRDIFDELRMVEMNAKALFQFAAQLGPIITYPEQYQPLPERPSLLEAKVPPTPKKASPARQKKSRPRSSSSSPA